MPIGFPAELDAPFKALWEDVSGVVSRWVMLLQLFGSKDRVELLNRAAPSLFHAVQQSLGDAVIIGIARLSDPPQMGKKENLTLLRLPALIPAASYPQLSLELQRRIDVFSAHCESVRMVRNRKLAHTDLPTRLNLESDAIPGVKREMVEDALYQIEDIMNSIDRYFRDSTTLFKEVIHTGDGDTLAYLLELGLAERTNAILRKVRPDRVPPNQASL
jgi:hypothetical protein